MEAIKNILTPLLKNGMSFGHNVTMFNVSYMCVYTCMFVRFLVLETISMKNIYLS